MRIENLDQLYDLRDTGLRMLCPHKPLIGVGLGTCGVGNGADAVYAALAEALKAKGVDARLRPVGCFGFCAAEPLVNIRLPNQPLVILSKVTPADVPEIVDGIACGQVPLRQALCKIQEWDHLTRVVTYGFGLPEVPNWDEIPFYRGQKKIVMRNCGLINPEQIEEYIAVGGYSALHQAMQKPNRTDIIEEVKRAKLRGRGGAGYPTGVKWGLFAKAAGDVKYLVCNADEGDPGAYMNRNEIESDPHMLLEGMLIGAYATGATHGLVYLRAEYPLAVKRFQHAIEEARAYGLLGDKIMGNGFQFDIQIVEGAGAFVCGEETAMIASLEGRAGRPRPRPPYPAQSGLWGKPTNINNVETWCNVPVIVARGSAWFATTGTANSSGTKVFSLVGKVRNTGLVEMPLGSPLKHIVYEIGQGSSSGRPVKAVQTGGPSGGCIPARFFDTPVDYEALGTLGSIMGSGGMVVMDEDTCMVDIARYFMKFSHSESCGKCIPCRAGLDQALSVLNRMTEGAAEVGELPSLEALGQMVKECSLCGLGQTAPNPMLTTMRYFREEYLRHIEEQRCPAGVCETLFDSPCENTCPLRMRIPGYLQLLKEQRPDEAEEMIWRDNPLPASTGRICPAPCEDRCARTTMDAPVNMREVHRHVADRVLQSGRLGRIVDALRAGKPPATGKRVAVVGSGPAGLTAAYYLALLGHDVTVYEERSQPGGMLRYAIPEFRLPKAILDQELEVLRQLGVRFVCECRVGRDVALDRLHREHDALFLSVGVWAKGEGLAGEPLAGVFSAPEFLARVASGDALGVGRHVVVVGGDAAALDAARTAVRLGAEVKLLYRRDRKDMRVGAAELADAAAEGVQFEFHQAVEKVVDDGTGKLGAVDVQQMRDGEFELSGRRKPEPTGQKRLLSCDAVIRAVEGQLDAAGLRALRLTVQDDGRVAVDARTLQTSDPKVYAGGDLVMGASDVVTAMGTGRRAAQALDQQLTGADRFDLALKSFKYRMRAIVKPEPRGRQEPGRRLPDERRTDFAEVVSGLDAEAVKIEIKRCLRCDVKDKCVHRK